MNKALEETQANFSVKGQMASVSASVRAAQPACAAAKQKAAQANWQGCVPGKLYLQKEARCGSQAELAGPLFWVSPVAPVLWHRLEGRAFSGSRQARWLGSAQAAPPPSRASPRFSFLFPAPGRCSAVFQYLSDRAERF